MNADPKSRDPKRLVWPLTGVLIAVLLGITPAKPHITFQAGVVTWAIASVLVLVLAGSPIGVRVAALLAGMIMAAPCFLRTSPLSRCVLICLLALPLVSASALLLVPPFSDLRGRLAYLSTWGGTRRVSRRASCLDAGALLHLVVATTIVAAAIEVVKAAPAAGLGLLARWLAGGIGFLAAAEMVTATFTLAGAAIGLTMPSLMQSPCLSASISEFWTKRWNPAASHLFRLGCFAPLAHGSPFLGLWAAFAVSAAAHALLVHLALGEWGISLVCGAFFLVQPLFLAVERRLKVRRWRSVFGHVWTVAVLAITSPLFMEPTLQIVERSWDAGETAIVPTAVLLGFLMLLSTGFALASLTALRPSSLAGAIYPLPQR